MANYKVSINTNDNLTGEFMGGKDYFDTEEEAKKFFNLLVIDQLESYQDAEIFIVDQKNYKRIAYFTDREED